MTTSEFISALVSLLLVGFLPGFLLSRALRPSGKWWIALAASPGLSCGITGTIGLLVGVIHLPFSGWEVVLIDAVLLGALLGQFHRPHLRRPSNAVALMVGAASVAGAVALVGTFLAFASSPVPPNVDASVHSTVATAIQRSGNILVHIPSPVTAGYWSRPRTGFEAICAAAGMIASVPAYQLMLPYAAVAASLIPLGLAGMILELSGSWQLAAFSPLLGIGMLLPLHMIAFGVYPLLLESTLVPVAVLALAELASSFSWRDALFLGAITASFWVTHGTEELTALLIAVPVLVMAIRQDGTAGWLRRLALGAIACCAGAVAISAMNSGPSSSVLPLSSLAGPATPAASLDLQPFAVFHDYPYLIVMRMLLDQYANPLQLALPFVAAYAALRRGQLLWAVAAFGIMLLIFVDASIYGVARPVWLRVFPWSEIQRLTAIQYWVVPLLEAAVLLRIGTFRRISLWRGGPRTTEAWRRTIAAAPALVAVSVGLWAVAGGILHMSRYYATANEVGAVVTSADTEAMSQMSRRLPRGSVILTDAFDDAGMWVATLTSDVGFFAPDYLHSFRDDVRLVSLERSCSDPVIQPSVLQGIDAIYVGSRDTHSAWHPWDPDCIRRIPGLTVIVDVARGGSRAVVYRVDRTRTVAADLAAAITVGRGQGTGGSSSGATPQ